MPPQLFEFEQDEDGIFRLPEVGFAGGSPDTGLRGAESFLPLPATQTLQQEGPPERPVPIQPPPPTPTPEPPPSPQPVQPSPQVPQDPNQTPFDLTGPLSKDRVSPEQQEFLTAAGEAVRSGDQQALLGLFRDDTRGLAKPFFGNLSLQAFPALFPSLISDNPSGQELLHRIRVLRNTGQIDPSLTGGEQVDFGGGFGSDPRQERRGGSPRGDRRGGGGRPGGGGGGGFPGGGGPGGGGGFPPGGGGFEPGPVPELPPPVPVPGGGGPTFPQLGGPGDEFSQVISDRLRGLIEGEAFDPAQFGGPARAAGQAQLADLAQTGGVDSDLIFNVEQSLRESLERQRQASQRTIDEELSGRRVSGAGLEAGRLADLEEDLFAQQATQLRDFATSIGLQGNQVRLSAAQALANQGLQERAQDINLFQQRTAQQLAALDLANERALGIGGLALQNLSLNSSFALAARQLQIDEAKFIENAKAARSGQITPMIGMLLQIANAMQAGFID